MKNLIQPKLGVILLCSVFFLFDFTPQPLSAAPDEVKTWKGKWKNKKYGTSGKIICKALPEGDEWEAKFTGIGLGEPFAYGATIKVIKDDGSKKELTGITKVDGGTYTWTATINGTRFTGKYRASNGNNGTFSMRESK